MVAEEVGAVTCAAGFAFFAACAALCSLYFGMPNQMMPATSPANTTTDAVMTKTVFNAFDLGLAAGWAPGAPAKRRPVAGTVVLCLVARPGGAGGGTSGADGAAAECGDCGTTMACWQDGQLICAPT